MKLTGIHTRSEGSPPPATFMSGALGLTQVTLK
jgi:hypothetical protein